jgi:lysophospholipase L1-like esterase
VVVSLGTNDAAVPDSVELYRSNYRTLLTELAAVTPLSAIAAIPLPEAGLAEASKVSTGLIKDYNASLPELAKEASSAFIPLPPLPEHHTIDGIHLNAAGYKIWDKAILQGIESALCKST